MSIYNSQSPFNQGAKRSEITAANKQRRQSRRQRVKDIKEAGGPEFYSADGYHVGEFDKKGRNIQYPEKRYSKKNPPNKGISGADMMSMQFHGYTDVPDSDERKSPMNQAEDIVQESFSRSPRQQLMVPMPKPKQKAISKPSKRLVKEKPLPMERLPLQPSRIMPKPKEQVYQSVGERLVKPKQQFQIRRLPSKVSPMNQGDIRQAPSRLTQAYRRFKNDESGPYSMARNLASTAVALAPLPIGKINAVKKVGKAISNIVKSKKTIPGGGGTYGKPNASNLKGTGPSRGGNFNEIIGPLGKGLNKSKVPKSKPVDYMGPNPAHKTGAGKNSYPK